MPCIRKAARRRIRKYFRKFCRTANRLLALQCLYAFGAAYECFRGELQKQSVLDCAHHMIEVMRGLFRITHRPKGAVDNVMPTISDVRFLVGTEPQRRFPIELS